MRWPRPPLRSAAVVVLLMPGCGEESRVLDQVPGADTDIGGDDTDPGNDDTDLVGPGLPALPCHPYDPLDVVGGSRTYAVTVRDQSGTETHTLGVTPPPGTPPGAFALRVQSAEPTASDLRLQARCDRGEEAGAFDVGFNGTLAGFALSGRANPPLRYLPPAAALDAGGTPRWEESTSFGLDVAASVPTCPSTLPLRRRTQASFEVLGTEALEAGSGAVDAVRIRVEQSERVELREDVGGTCRTALEAVGVIGDRAATDVVLHRWYVRGLGLVAAIVAAPDDGACADPAGAQVPPGCAPVSIRRLTSCQGLRGCP